MTIYNAIKTIPLALLLSQIFMEVIEGHAPVMKGSIGWFCAVFKTISICIFSAVGRSNRVNKHSSVEFRRTHVLSLKKPLYKCMEVKKCISYIFKSPTSSRLSLQFHNCFMFGRICFYCFTKVFIIRMFM